MEHPSNIKLWQPIVTLVVIVLLIIYLLNVFNTSNWLWFLPYQPTYQPTRIIVHNYGKTETLQPGTPGYTELTDAMNEAFANGFNSTALVNIGLSDETLRRYNEEELVIEAHYPVEVRFNTPVRMKNVRSLIVPVDATHDGNRYLFMGSNGLWLAGALVMSDDAPIMNAMMALGYLEAE